MKRRSRAERDVARAKPGRVAVAITPHAARLLRVYRTLLERDDETKRVTLGEAVRIAVAECLHYRGAKGKNP